MAEGNSFNAVFGSAGGGGGSTTIVWGDITGTLSNQTDLQNALNDKQDTLVSGTNIKTINSTSILGSGDITIDTNTDWGDIGGTLSNQTDLQNALDDKVSKSDYTPAKSLLVQQSGTGSPSSLSVAQNTLIGRKNGGSSEIEDLNATEVKDLLGYAEVNPTSTFLPINTSGSFTDSPFYTLPTPAGFTGFGGIATKSSLYFTEPSGGVPNYNDFGLEIKSYSVFTGDSSVSLGDYAQSLSADTGEFYWYTGQRLNGSDSSGSPYSFLPQDTSGIVFNTNNYDLLNLTREFLKLDVKGGNPALVDGILYNKGIGMIGFGSGLNADFINNNSNESALYWDFNGLSFTINSAQGQSIFRNNSWQNTYMSVFDSAGTELRLGVNTNSVFVTTNLTATASPTTSTKVLRLDDSSGNSYYIKLYDTP